MLETNEIESHQAIEDVKKSKIENFKLKSMMTEAEYK